MVRVRRILAHVVKLFGALCRWWLGELAASLPSGLRRLGKRGRETLVLEIGGDHAVLTRSSGNGAKNYEQVDLAGGQKTPDTVARKLSIIDRERTDIIVRLPASQALRRTVSLPLATEENLRQVLFFELDRLTPFTGDAVLFDHRVLQRDAGNQRLQVELTVVPKTTVDQAVDRAMRLDLVANIVDVAAAEGGSAPSGNLLAEDKRPTKRLANRPAVMLLGVVAAALSAIVIYLPLARQQDLGGRLSQQAAEMRHRAEAVAKLQKEITSLVQDQESLIGKKLQTYATIDILSDLTRLLPDETYLLQWQLTGSQLQISGYSPSASSIIPLIEQSPMFERAMFRSPVTPDQRLGRERFQISAEVVPRGRQ